MDWTRADDVLNLISNIYDEATQPNPWAETLKGLKTLLEADAAILRVVTIGDPPKHVLYASDAPDTPEAIKAWEKVSPYDLLPITAFRIGEGRIVVWNEYVGYDRISDLLARFDIKSTISVCLDFIDGLECSIHCNRGAGRPAFGTAELGLLKKIGKHFAQALHLRRALAEDHTIRQLHADALDRLGISALLVKSDRTAKPMNVSASRMLATGDILKIQDGKIQAASFNSSKVFRRALDAAIRSAGHSQSLILEYATDDKKVPRGNVNVAVCSRQVTSGVSGRQENCAVIYVRTNSSITSQDIRSLQQLFQLTPSEARLAVGLATTPHLKDLERELRISHNTARAHLRSMYAKTDVSSRSELIGLINNSMVELVRDRAETFQ